MTNQKRVRLFITGLTLVLALASLAVLVGSWAARYLFTEPINLLADEFSANRDTREQVKTLTNEVELLKRELDTLTDVQGTTPNELALKRLNLRANSLGVRMTALEDVISGDPVQELASAFLRVDIDDIREDMASNQNNIRLELDRIYLQNNVFIGLIGTTLLALIGFIVNSFANQANKT